jgi:hypothetical protein
VRAYCGSGSGSVLAIISARSAHLTTEGCAEGGVEVCMSANLVGVRTVREASRI